MPARSARRGRGWKTSRPRRYGRCAREIVRDISPLKPSKNPELLVATIEAVPRATAVTESRSEKEEVSGSRVVKEGSEQKEVGLSELQQEVRSQVQEGVVKDVLSVDRTELRKTDTQELLSEPQLDNRELEAELRHMEVASFDRTGLIVTEGEEKKVLPGHSDIQLERAKIELIGGIPSCEPEPPAQGSVKEPNGGTDLVRQERGHQAVQ